LQARLAYAKKAGMTGAFLLIAGLAYADADGDAWLQRIDATARMEDAHVELDVKVTDARGRTSQRSIEIWQKGDEKRLVRMTAPSRLAGIGLLASPGEKLHMFLPNYPPARRIVGSRRSDAFVGTDFAIEDLSRMRYAGTYSAQVIKSEGDLTQLKLTNNRDAKEPATHLWVDADAVVRTVEHLNPGGNVARRLQLSDIRPVGRARLAHLIEVTDLKRNRVTSATIVRIDTEHEIDDAIFSVTNLERP
jgi:hypothetical protein